MLAHAVKLKAFALKLTKSVDAAEDLTQDTFIRAIKYRDRFTPGTNMKAWLFMIARNQFISGRRRSWRQLPWDDELAERTLTTETEVSEADATIDLNRLLLCIACLPQEQADGIIALGYLGLTYEDTAWIFGVAAGTVKSRVSRARKELLNLLENADGLENVDTSAFRTLTQGLPKSDPYFPIAKAYEELYASTGSSPKTDQHQKLITMSDEDAAWNALVTSGALDEHDGSLDDLFRMDETDL
jgi:RNA polymerase sigma-70 factor (ECF subfamily)